jgi:hypothetical protein
MSWRGAPQPPWGHEIAWLQDLPSKSGASAELTLHAKVILSCAGTLSYLAFLLPIILHTSCLLSLCMHWYTSPGRVSAVPIPDLTASLLIW